MLDRQANQSLKPGNFAKVWRPLTVASVVLMLFALQGATTGFVPGVSDPDTALVVVLGCVVLSLLLSPVIYSAALVEDARRLEHSPASE